MFAPPPAAPPVASTYQSADASEFGASGLTAEEEAMLEADLGEADFDVDVDGEDLDLDDDWGLDEEEKKD